jgi:integrase
MERVLKIAKLPAHFTPHSLRHTFCSLLITQGISPVYVQQQAGHASVQMTVGVYGSWFPVRVPGAIDLMAAGLDVVTVEAKAVTSGSPIPEQPLAPTGTCGRAPVSRPSPG